MAKNHPGQMALYEVVNRERFKAAQKKELSRVVVQDKPEKVQPVVPAQPVTIPPQQPKNADVKQTVWTKKPRILCFNNGRVEIVLPYLHAVTVIMALSLLLIGSWRLGRWAGKSNTEQFSAKNTDTAVETTVTLDAAKVAKEMARSAVAKRATPAQAATAESASSGEGEYAIVLAELKNTSNAKDLEPAKQYFDEHGIATEIKNVRGSYFLVTTERYDSVRRGTPGAAVIEKIGQIGANYKAPSGYGGFGSKPFSDAYGRKM
jgi:hypothetical protein